MASNKLSDSECKNAKCPANKQQIKLSDGEGLYLLIKSNGTKSWRMAYTFHDHENTLTFGLYPLVTLKEAREKRFAARKSLEAGVDPKAAERAEKAALANKFSQVAEEWVGKQRTWSEKTRSMAKARIATYFADFASWPISDVKPSDVRRVLDDIEAEDKVETAHRVLNLFRKIEAYALVTERVQHVFAPALAYGLAKHEKSHFAAITDRAAFGRLLLAIDGYQGQPEVQLALKLSPLLFQRPSELRCAKWGEFDLKAATWSIPAERMKKKNPHVVPLSKQAVALLKELKEKSPGYPILFPGLRAATKPISDNTLNAALRTMGYSNKVHVTHGFRASARTLIEEELGTPRYVIELQLAHETKDANGSAYNRVGLMPERTRMMQQWADLCDQMKAEAQAEAQSRAA